MSIPATAVGAAVPLHPLLLVAQPHLDAIGREELALILGGLIVPFLAIWLGLRSVSTTRAHCSWTVGWLVLCVVVHCYLELHFVFFRDQWIKNGMNLYAAADFRYGSPLEAGTAAMETITALIVGPLCLLLAYAIVTNRSWRHGLQLIVCTCQLYGLTWFLLHPTFYHLPVASEDPFLFWVIFVGLNAPWGIVPPILAFKSLRQIERVFAADQRLEAAAAGKSNGKKHQ